MKKIKLKTGYLIVPDDCIVMYDTRDENSNFAAIIAEQYQSMPHYVFFADTPLEGIMQENEDLIYFVWGKLYPQLRSMWLAEVNAEVDKDGRLLNVEEWSQSQHLGLFPVPEVESEKHLLLGTGIIRKES